MPVSKRNNFVDKSKHCLNVSIYQTLPSEVRNRIKALKKLQKDVLQNEVKFYNDLHQLELKYQVYTSKIYKKRGKIIKGKVEVTNDDCTFNDGTESPDEDDPAIKEERSKFKLIKKLESSSKGIPGFWLNVMKSSCLTCDLVTDVDEPILEYLVDVAVILHQQPGFTLYFEFSTNPYFKNKVLTKEFILKCELDLERGWRFDGPEVTAANGCVIEWYDGMDTTRVVKEKKSCKWVEGKGRVVLPEKEVSVTDSFFNFFNNERDDGADQEYFGLQRKYVRLMELMLGMYFREEIIPRAVLYFTGDTM